MTNIDQTALNVVVPAQGLTIILGARSGGVWVVITNVAVGTTGPAITLTPSPSQGPLVSVMNGDTRHIYYAEGLSWLLITGNGATVSYIIADRDVPSQTGTTIPA